MEKGSEVLKRAKSKSEQIEKKGDKVTVTVYGHVSILLELNIKNCEASQQGILTNSWPLVSKHH